jgi:hypothetical protein
MLFIEWLYTYHEGPVAGLAKWQDKNKDTIVWFTIEDEKTLYPQVEKTKKIKMLSKDEMSKLSQVEQFEFMADNFKNYRKRELRRFKLYLLSEEQIEEVTTIYKDYCNNMHIKPGYLRDNSLLKEAVPNDKQQLDKIVDSEGYLELKATGLTIKHSTSFNISLNLDKIWMVIDEKDIINYVPQ